MKNRDKRTRLMSELLANIRRQASLAMLRRSLSNTFSSIKLYAWENAFIRWILAVRNEQELKMLRKIGIVTVSAVVHSQMNFNFKTHWLI